LNPISLYPAVDRLLPAVVALLGAVLLGFSSPTWAQVNTEKMRALDVDGVETTLGADAVVQAGNADLFEVGARARIDLRSGRHYAFLTTDVRYGEEDGERFRDRAFAHVRYSYRLTPWLSPESFTQVEENGFTLLQLRLLFGLGLRFQYVDAEFVKVFQGTTPMLEVENLDGGRIVNHPASTTTLRWSNYVNVRLRISETTFLLNTVYVQPRAGEPEDVRVLNEAVIAVSITKHVLLRVGLQLYYDSRPPENIEDLDVTLRNGLQVSF
jgi:putative salt-induced outer membrane protein YdiY